jgi:hypothetical protein
VNKGFVSTRAFVSDLILLYYRATTRAVNAVLAAMELGHATKMAAMGGSAAVPEITLDVLAPNSRYDFWSTPGRGRDIHLNRVSADRNTRELRTIAGHLAR